MIYLDRMRWQITESQALWAVAAAIIGIDAIWAWSLGIRIVLNPLVDRYLAAADSVIGFDWLALFMWVHERPLIGKILFVAYNSGIFQMGVLLVVLNVLGRLERAREFVWLFVLTLLI